MSETDITPPYARQAADFVAALDTGEDRYPAAKTQTLPMSLYLSEERLRAERADLFAKAPIIVGHIGMLEKPGDHFTFDHLGKPLMIVRGQEGDVRAFLNVCRHRGTRLSNSEEVSRKPNFVCPYHNWIYALDGELTHVPLEDTFEGVDLSCRSLKQLPCSVENGFIYVSLDPDAKPDVKEFLGEISDDFAAFNMGSQHVFARSIRTKKTNWKLILEAFEDGYHVIRLHRNTIGSMFLDSVSDIERIGDHLRSIVARNSFDEMRAKPEADWKYREDMTFAYFLFPNTIIIIHPDYISHLGLYPTATDETVCVHTCMIDKKPTTEKEQAHFERAFKIIDDGVFNAEDFHVCEQAQIGMDSGANETFPLSRHEVGIKLLHDIFDEHLEIEQQV